MGTKEIANKESKAIAVNQNPDMCIVGQSVVPFDITRDLSNSIKHSPNVNARGVPVITVCSVIQGVVGNNGMGVLSGVSQGAGFVVITSGATSVNTNSLNTARHLSECQMNCPGPVGTNGTTGTLQIQQLPPIVVTAPKLPCNQPPKSNAYLDALKKAKAYVAANDPGRHIKDAPLDEWDKTVSNWIDSYRPSNDPWSPIKIDADIQRAKWGFAKDLLFGAAHLGQWLQRRTNLVTAPGTLADDFLSARITEANILAGNVCWESVKDTAGKVWDKLVEPITKPWKKGDYAEALTRGTLEVVSMAFAVGDVIKGIEAAKAARLAAAGDVLKVASAERLLAEGVELGEAVNAARQGGKLGELVSEARNAGKLPELLSEGKLTSQELDDLVKAGKLTEEEAAASKSSGVKVSSDSGKYGHLEDPEGVGPGKDFTPEQKQKIIEENMKQNGGVVRSDEPPYQILSKPQKSMKGVTPDPNEWQIDHIIPKSKGGTNSYGNAQILSRQQNRAKWNN